MQDFSDTAHQEQCLTDSVKELEKVNKQLAKLLVRKDELTDIIIGALEHDHAGQKTYEYGVWKLEVKTPFSYSLNKKLYESAIIKLPEDFNPIKTSVAYSIDKRLCEQYMADAPKKVRDALRELIDIKPGKAGVTIKARM